MRFPVCTILVQRDFSAGANPISFLTASGRREILTRRKQRRRKNKSLEMNLIRAGAKKIVQSIS
jgi:hypothetical protein